MSEGVVVVGHIDPKERKEQITSNNGEDDDGGLANRLYWKLQLRGHYAWAKAAAHDRRAENAKAVSAVA